MGIDAIIALIGSLIPVVNNVIGFINRTTEELKRNKELTAEQFQALRTHVESIDAVGTHWQTDEEKATGNKKP